jgi:hemin uptake protein HemP
VLPNESYDQNPDSGAAPAHSEDSPGETESPIAYDSGDLLKGQREIIIRHHGEVYRLRLTRNGKLILNK